MDIKPQHRSFIRTALTVVAIICLLASIFTLLFVLGYYFFNARGNGELKTTPTPTQTSASEFIEYKYTLNQAQLPDGVADFPKYQLNLILPPGVGTSINTESTKLEIKNVNFSLAIESSPGDNGGVFENVPEVTVLSNVLIDSPVYRIKIETEGNSYYYTHDYSTDSSVCSQYSFDSSPVACGQPWLIFKQNVETGNLIVNCSVTVEENVSICDEIVEKMEVKLITEY